MKQKVSRTCKRIERILSAALAVLTALSIITPALAVPVEAATKKVEDYSYTITPLLAPFNHCFYVKTDNPDPKSFTFWDKSSKYKDECYNAWEGTKYDRYDPYSYPSIALSYSTDTPLFLDVKYENKSTQRVKGGYLFWGNYTDGGKLMLMDGTRETGKYVTCSSVKDTADWLIDKYTNPSKSFFKNLDAVQNAVCSFYIYPQDVLDTTSVSSLYPYYYNNSHYPEGVLNPQDEVQYNTAGPILLQWLYPFSLNSASCPGLMEKVAYRLGGSRVTIKETGHHAWRDILYDGKTNGENIAYGGAGEYAGKNIHDKYIKTYFKFDGTTSDYGTKVTVSTLHDTLYNLIQTTDKNNDYKDKYRKALDYDSLKGAIGKGTWAKIQGLQALDGKGRDYAYFLPPPNNTGLGCYLTRAWVDGRYVNEFEVYEAGATFDMYPTARVVKTMNYTDVNGNRHTSVNVIFDYDNATKKWCADPVYYYNGYVPDKINLPAEFFMTKSQVLALKPDRNTNITPQKGIILDGSKYPGTAYKNVQATGIEFKVKTHDGKVKTVKNGDTINVNPDVKTITLYAEVTPKNAAERRVLLKSYSNAGAAGVVCARYKEGREYYESGIELDVYANKQGKGYLTFATMDGLHTVTLNLNIGPAVKEIKVDSDNITLKVGEKYTLKPQVLPSTVLDKGVSYLPFVKGYVDESIVSVNSSGVITAKKEGQAYITIYLSGRQCNVSVTVEKASGVTSPVDNSKAAFRRIYGKSRYETATKIVDKTKELSNVKKLNAIIVAIGTNYPDALSGAYLAKAKDAPILITSNSEESKTISYIKNNVSKNATVYILGGTSAISMSFQNKIKPNVGKVIRLGGKSRFDTNLMILRNAGRLSKELIVVTGKNFPDALSASATGLPILIVGDSLTNEQKNFLKSNKYEVITIIGGTGAVSNKVANDLSNYGKVKRITGKNRYETSSNVASNYFKTAKSVVLATGLNYPDALTGGPLAIKQKAPMILTSSNPTDYSYARAYTQKVKAKNYTVLGGPSLVSDNAVLAIAK